MQKETKNLLKNTWKLIQITWNEDKKLFILYFSSSFLGAILMYAVYFVYKIMIDQITRNALASTSSAVLLIISSYLFFEYLSRFVNFTFNQYYFDYFIRAKLQNALTRKFMNKLADLDFANLENGETRNLIAKVENTYAFRLPEILHTLNAIVYNVAALLLSLAIAFQFNVVYFVILALVSIPIYYLRAKYGNIAWTTYSTNASNTNQLWYIRSLFTNFQTLSEMKIYGLREHFMQKTKQLQDKVLDDYQKPITLYMILSTVSFLLIPIAIFFAIQHFLTGMEKSIFTIGDFTFFLNALFTFSGQISSFLINLGTISENSLYLNDFFKLQETKNIIHYKKDSKKFSSIEPRTITFENVTFQYPGAKRPSLSNINITIEKGQNTAIVGENGAGKSTLIKLLFRFYDPTEGRILIDGVDLRDINIDHWYNHLGVLFQDFAKYFLTLEENIKFGNMQESSSEEIRYALIKSRGDDVLKTLPNGMQQILGRWFAEGLELSGGQWQKVAIARAIFRGAPFLILDEPTSAIDADAESEIFENLNSLYREKNLIFISHRFSTVRMAEKIFVLHNGKVAEEGNHYNLIQKNGIYSDFFNLQRKGYE